MSSQNTIVYNITAYSIIHAIVDTASAWLLSHYAYLLLVNIFQTCDSFFCKLDPFGVQILLFVIFYNFLAFGLQSVIGFVADTYHLSKEVSVGGVLLISLGLVFVQFPLIAVLLVGIGNAMFHVGGGIITLSLQPTKATLPGIFVAPGAFGLALGGVLGLSGLNIALPLIVLFIVASIVLYLIPKPHISYETDGTQSEHSLFEMTLVIILLAIAIGSFIELSFVFPWKTSTFLILFLAGVVVLGKGLGGILADRFGWKRVAFVSMLVSAPFLALSVSYPFAAMVGVLLFSMMVPITLTAFVNMFPGRTGFAFGVTKLMLLVGMFPAFIRTQYFEYSIIFTIMAVLVTATLLYYGLSMYRKIIN